MSEGEFYLGLGECRNRTIDRIEMLTSVCSFINQSVVVKQLTTCQGSNAWIRAIEKNKIHLCLILRWARGAGDSGDGRREWTAELALLLSLQCLCWETNSQENLAEQTTGGELRSICADSLSAHVWERRGKE